MAKFTVDLDALLVAADQMSTFDTELEHQLSRVRASVDALGLTWQGDAAERQRAAQERWNSGADELRAALGQLRDIAENAHSNYSGAAANNTRMWQ